VGDPSDNYPGVKGIGPKTAQKLLNELDSLENIYKELRKNNIRSYANFSQRIAKLLEKDEENVLLAKKLAKIVLDAPVEIDLEKAKLGRLDGEEVEEKFKELEFKSLWKRVKKTQNDKKTKKSGKVEKQEESQQMKIL